MAAFTNLEASEDVWKKIQKSGRFKHTTPGGIAFVNSKIIHSEF
jgi:hypothetical protein